MRKSPGRLTERVWHLLAAAHTSSLTRKASCCALDAQLTAEPPLCGTE